MRILLVEDDPLLGEGLQTGLRQQGMTADWLTDGQLADTALLNHDFEAVVLDLGLPRIDGLTVLKRLRARGDQTPVLILTARDAIEDRVAGLDAGADDYLTKPFALAELQARIRALLRRAHGIASPVLKHGALELDPARHCASLAGAPLLLAQREFTLLQALLEHQGRALSREQLESELYGWGEEVESNAIEVHIHHLRKKLGSDWIKTLRGVGYLLNPTPPQS